MKRFLCMALAAFSSFVTTVGAQTVVAPQGLTLSQAVATARRHSLSAQIAADNYLYSYWQYVVYKAGRLPTLSLQTTPLQYYRSFVKRYDSQNNVDIYKPQKSLYSALGFQVQKKIEATGGSVYMETDLAYLKNYGVDNSHQFSSVPFRVGYSQELFGYNALKWNRQLEPKRFEKARRQLLYELEEVAAQTVKKYFAYALALKNVALAEANIARCDTAVQIAEERQKIGTVTRADLLTLQLTLLNAKKELNTRQLQAEQAGKALQTFLQVDTPVLPSATLPLPETAMKIFPEEAVRMACREHPRMVELELQRISAQQNLDMVRKSRFATQLSVSVGFNQVADEFWDAYHRPLRQDVVSLSLNIPIYDWGAGRGQVAQAKSRLDATQRSIRQERAAFEEEVADAVRRWNESATEIQMAAEACRMAAEAYDATYERFLIGKATVDGLNMAQTRQCEAERDYLNALSGYWTCFYEVRKYTLYNFVDNCPLEVEADMLPSLSDH